MNRALNRLLVACAFALTTAAAYGQGAVLQAGPTAPGRAPMYVGQGSQTQVQDSGPAGGGSAGIGLKELGITTRGSGPGPHAGQGSGEYGTSFCMRDAPINNAAGYHYLCLDANAQGGGLIAYGAGGTAPALPFQFLINGAPIPSSLVALGAQPANTILCNPTNVIALIQACTGTQAAPIVIAAPAFTQTGTGALTRSVGAELADWFKVKQFAACAGNNAVDDSVGINRAITQLNSAGGGAVVFNNGTDCRLQNPIIMKQGVYLIGPGPILCNYGGGAFVGAKISPGASVSSLITQTTPGVDLHSIGIIGMSICGNKVAGFTVTNLVDITFINGRVENNYIADGSGNCLWWHQPTNPGTDPGWVNWFRGNSIGGCAGWGFIAGSTDSVITDNYISGNGVGGIQTLSAGSNRISNNHIEVSPVCIEMDNALSQTTLFMTNTVVGNVFPQCGTAIHLKNTDAANPHPCFCSIEGNLFALSANQDILADANVTHVAIGDANNFQQTATLNISFNGDTNTFWHVGGVYGLTPAGRFSNVPADLQILGSGTGGQSVRLDGTGHVKMTNSVEDGFSSKLTGSSQFSAYSADVNATNQFLAYFKYQGAQVGTISTNGTTTTYATTSDRRLKDDERPYTGASDVLDQLKIWDFRWKADGSRSVGVFAQEANAVFAQAVLPGHSETDMWQVDYSKFSPLLIADAQATHRRLAELTEQNAALLACQSSWACRLFGWK